MAGFDVVAVEPLAELRGALTDAIGAERVLAGTAEAIPLPDAAVAAAVCGDAFHWFDRERAPAELHRVVASRRRRRGRLARAAAGRRHAPGSARSRG